MASASRASSGSDDANTDWTVPERVTLMTAIKAVKDVAVLVLKARTVWTLFSCTVILNRWRQMTRSSAFLAYKMQRSGCPDLTVSYSTTC